MINKINKKVLIIVGLVIILGLFSGVTYSIFHSRVKMKSHDQKIAKFIFNVEHLDDLEIPLVDIIPGEEQEYLFSVTNNSEEKISDVTLEYQITIKTYHFLPLIIELFKIIEEETEELILTCDDSFERSTQNELVCEVPLQEMVHSEEVVDNYKLRIEFPEDKNEEVYASLVDFINLEIRSWQKISK